MTTRLFIALYLDSDMSRRIAQALRAEGFDAVSAWDVHNEDMEDEQQLEYATGQQRALVTFNKDDFAKLLKVYSYSGKEHYGIIVSEQLVIGEVLRRLLRLLDTVSADEMKNSFRNLGEFK
ncbi:MAG: DUF5615 family PIN-like protein [Chloroflexi bacterium]|nr:DUF5615 family PIN-like protein [Chloroflexota bacterium]